VLRLVAALEQRGYRVLLFSNIGHAMWQDLRARHAAALAPFEDSRVHCTHPPQYLRKPDPRAFRTFLNRFRRRPNEQFVLIDDSPEKCALCSRNNLIFTSRSCRVAPLVDKAMAAILYTNSQELEALLTKWHVL
jgi:FMN phosphatase YigB (HAD superfamily)